MLLCVVCRVCCFQIDGRCLVHCLTCVAGCMFVVVVCVLRLACCVPSRGFDVCCGLFSVVGWVVFVVSCYVLVGVCCLLLCCCFDVGFSLVIVVAP